MHSIVRQWSKILYSCLTRQAVAAPQVPECRQTGRSDLSHAAVDGQIDPRAKAAVVRSEEQGCRGQFLRAPHPAERNGLREGLAQLVRLFPGLELRGDDGA